MPPAGNLLYNEPVLFQVKKITAAMLTEGEVASQATEQMEEEFLKDWNPWRVFHPGIREELENRFSYVYPYEYRKDIPVKITVSELKKRSYKEEEYETPEANFLEEELVPVVPGFIEDKAAEEKTEYTGAARGTAYHRVLECLDYRETDSREMLEQQIKNLVDSGKMSQGRRLTVSELQI